MAENKNQISTQEWSDRMRSAGRQTTTSPASISRAPVNTSGPLAQIRQNLTALNNQKYGLALANIKGQYNLADKMASLTQNINANAIARKEQLYANRQANLDRMAQMYGQYYQQFGNVLNKEALDFLDQHSNIKVPTLTAIMAGYEHARASRAEQALAALDRTAKMAEAEAALAEKQTALENEKAANDQYANLQKLDAQSKANQAVYDAQKAYLDEQARNEMLGAGLASTGRGTGVRALPGFGGGVGAGARAGVGRVPSAVTGARSGQTVAGGATPTGRVVQTADGQTVAVDNNKNVIGTVVPTQNGSVVVNGDGQTVGSVDANGNVMPIAAEPQMGAYAQYQAAGGGGFWSNPVENVLDAADWVVPLGAIPSKLGESARLGYLTPEARAANSVSRAFGRPVVNNAGRIATGTGKILRGIGNVTGGKLFRTLSGKLATRLGMSATGGGAVAAIGLTALDTVPRLAGAATGAVVQGAKNIRDYVTGGYDRQVMEAIATGQPIPQRPSIWQTAGDYGDEANAWFWNQVDANMIPGRFVENFGMKNREDVNNFSRFFRNITGNNPTYQERRTFDKQPDIVRTTILNGMLTNKDLNAESLQAFIDDTIRTSSSPQEQQAIQQQIQTEDYQDILQRSLGTSGDSKPIQAVIEEMQKHFANSLKTDVGYEDIANAADEYLQVVSYAESRDKPGAVGANTSNGRAESIYQIMPGTLQEWKTSFLKDLGYTLSPEQKELLINARTANDLDNDLGRPILGAMVLRRIYKDIAVRNEKFDKRGTNIRSDQMFLDLVKMNKLARENGQEKIDPVRYGDYLTLWATNHVRGTTPEAVRQGLLNGNTVMDEEFGPRRNAQGGNDAWWTADFNGFDRYANLLGLNVPQTQQAGYSFDVAPGVDVDNLNTLLLQRFSAANDAMVSATGVKGRMNSGKRSPSKQADLYRNKASNPNPVARSGWSKHEAGVALDFNNDEWEKAFNGSDQLKHNYGTFDNFLNSFGIQRGVTDKNGKRSDLVHLTMIEDDEYHNAIDHDRLMASRGKWGDQPGNYWMRGVGSTPRQVQPAWDVSPQYMLENFGYPIVEYLATDYDPDMIFANEEEYAPYGVVAGYGDEGYGQSGVVFDYDENGYPIFQ